MEKIKKFLLAGVLIFATLFGVVMPQHVMAAGGVCSSGDKAGEWVDDMSNCGVEDKSFEKFLKNVVEFLLIIIGVLAVIFIIIGAFKYITSAGDTAKLKQARDTILYSVAGLVVAMLAFAIVEFVVKKLGLT